MVSGFTGSLLLKYLLTQQANLNPLNFPCLHVFIQTSLECNFTTMQF